MDNSEKVIQFNNRDFLKEVTDLALLGLTDKQIAKAWNMSFSQFRSMKKNPKFTRTLTASRLRADKKIAAKLYEMAINKIYG